MRTIKYFWLKRVNIIFGLILVIPFPGLTYLWLSGKLVQDPNEVGELVANYSNPGFLQFPIACSVLFFLAGVIALLYVFFRLDIDEVMPLRDA